MKYVWTVDFNGKTNSPKMDDSVQFILIFIGLGISIIAFIVEISVSASVMKKAPELVEVSSSHDVRNSKIALALSVVLIPVSCFCVASLFICSEMSTGFLTSLIYGFPLGLTWFIYMIMLTNDESSNRCKYFENKTVNTLTDKWQILESVKYAQRVFNISDMYEIKPKVSSYYDKNCGKYFGSHLSAILISFPFSIPYVAIPSLALAIVICFCLGAGSGHHHHH